MKKYYRPRSGSHENFYSHKKELLEGTTVPIQMKHKNTNYRHKGKLLYCTNCDTLGHNRHRCRQPITSYGIILYSTDTPDKQPVYLLVQQKYSHGYTEIMRGKYENKEYPDDYLDTLVNDTTIIEQDNLTKMPFETLWRQMWPFSYKDLNYRKDFSEAIYVFNKKKEHIKKNIIKLRKKNIEKINIEPGWGFPKGRRNTFEGPRECANREFLEETGLSPNSYKLIKDECPVEDVFMGENGVSYRHIFYLAKTEKQLVCYINPHNLSQTTEVRKIGWFSYEQTKKNLNDVHKIKLLDLANLIINN